MERDKHFKTSSVRVSSACDRDTVRALSRTPDKS